MTAVNLSIDNRRKLSIHVSYAEMMSVVVDQVELTWIQGNDDEVKFLAAIFVTAVDLGKPVKLFTRESAIANYVALWIGVVTGDSPDQVGHRLSTVNSVQYNEDQVSDAVWNYLWPSHSRTSRPT